VQAILFNSRAHISSRSNKIRSGVQRIPNEATKGITTKTQRHEESEIDIKEQVWIPANR